MEETNNTTTTSSKGKGLGIAGMVIGIVALIWAMIPLLGAGAWWLAVVGLVLSAVGFVMAKGGNNPNKGMMMTGIILGVVATALSFYRVYQVTQAVSAFEEIGKEFATEMKAAMDSAKSEAIDAIADSLKAH